VNLVRIKIPTVAFVVVLFAVNAFIKINSDFGIDVERYKIVLENGISEWSVYYLKEFVSWGVLDFLSKFSPYLDVSQQLILLDFLVLLLLIFGCRGGAFAGYRFILFYASFAFILLSFNVLRQYLSIAFLIIALVAAVHGWRWRFAISIILAIASHNGTVLLVPSLLLVFFREFKPTTRVLLAIAGICLMVLMSTNESVGRAFEAGSEALEEPFWKVLLYAFLSVHMVVLFRMRHKDIVRYRSDLLEAESRAAYLNLSLLLFGVVISITPFPNWIISRNWLGIISLQAFLYLGFQGAEKYTYSSARRFFFFYFIPMSVLVFLHPGSRQMAFDM